MSEPLRLPIYLDYMATTPVDPQVIEVMSSCLSYEGHFGNPASQSHSYGFAASELVQLARQQVASLINADHREIIWTSGATESNNLAIKGAAYFYQNQGRHIVTMATEHKSVLDPCRFLETEGFTVTYLKPQADGLINLAELNAAIQANTILVSTMLVNNEIGVVQDLAAIAEIVKKRGALLHVDAAQAAGKVLIDLKKLPVDLMSFSAHKVYGPKGIGALFVRRNPQVRLTPLIHGGGHERGLRSGTLPTHQIVGMGKAFEIAGEVLEQEKIRLQQLKDRLWVGLSKLAGVCLHGHASNRIPGCLNVYFKGVEGESLLLALQKIAISSGSACNSADPSPSHVLTGCGIKREEAYSSLRISLGRFTTEADIDFAIQHISEEVRRLRAMSPIEIY